MQDLLSRSTGTLAVGWHGWMSQTFQFARSFSVEVRNSVGSASRREPGGSLSSFLVSTTTVAMGSICGAGDGDSAPQPARILDYNTAVFVFARVDLWSGGKRRCIGREKTRRKVVRIGGISRVRGPGLVHKRSNRDRRLITEDVTI